MFGKTRKRLKALESDLRRENQRGDRLERAVHHLDNLLLIANGMVEKLEESLAQSDRSVSEARHDIRERCHNVETSNEELWFECERLQKQYRLFIALCEVADSGVRNTTDLLRKVTSQGVDAFIESFPKEFHGHLKDAIE